MTRRQGDPLPADLVLRAQQGDKDAREDLVSRYRPFVLGVAARVSGRYLDDRADDEFQVALIAFNEAIDAFESQRGVAFLTFSETVIRRRLIDHFRREGSRKEQPLSSLDVEDDEGNVQNPADTQAALTTWEGIRENDDRRLEIEAFSRALIGYGLTFDDLVGATPRHVDAREAAQGAARALILKPDLVGFVEREGRLPLRELSEIVPVSRKTLERQRRYILAMVLVLTGDYPYLRSYLS